MGRNGKARIMKIGKLEINLTRHSFGAGNMGSVNTLRWGGYGLVLEQWFSLRCLRPRFKKFGNHIFLCCLSFTLQIWIKPNCL